MRWLWAVLPWLAMLVVARDLRAADAEAIAVRYDAPTGCPDEATFFGEVSARTTRARRSAAGEPARVLVVHVERRGAAFAGQLTIEDAQTRSTPRDVTGESCGEVVGALALVAALAVDPSASVAPRPPPSAERREEERPVDKVVEPTNSGTRVAGLVGAGLEASARADAVVGARLFGEIDVGTVAIRLTAMRTFTVERVGPLGSVTLAWTTGSLEVCPLRIGLGSDVDVRPCAAFGAGILEAKGGKVRDARDETRPWLDAGAHGRLSWNPVGPLVLEMEVGANMALLRESFRFDPDVLAYQVPVIAAFARAGVGVRFP